ncbi:MAG: DUF3035 domain-containing protein [Thermaurantiacus sp.]
MTRSIILLAALVSAGLVAGCGRTSVANRDRPDEFAVGRAQPLVIPPEFGMVPPRPGAPRPVEIDTRAQALEALFGPGVQLPPRSEIENRLLEGARTSQADPMIRNTAGELRQEMQTVGVDKGAFLRELLDAPVGTRNAQIARVSVGG